MRERKEEKKIERELEAQPPEEGGMKETTHQIENMKEEGEEEEGAPLQIPDIGKEILA